MSDVGRKGLEVRKRRTRRNKLSNNAPTSSSCDLSTACFRRPMSFGRNCSRWKCEKVFQVTVHLSNHFQPHALQLGSEQHYAKNASLSCLAVRPRSCVNLLMSVGTKFTTWTSVSNTFPVQKVRPATEDGGRERGLTQRGGSLDGLSLVREAVPLTTSSAEITCFCNSLQGTFPAQHCL